jgi:hypothetical protein
MIWANNLGKTTKAYLMLVNFYFIVGDELGYTELHEMQINARALGPRSKITPHWVFEKTVLSKWDSRFCLLALLRMGLELKC